MSIAFKTGFRFPPITEELTELNFSEMFGNTHPVEIEIGCGKGRYLVHRAKESPETNFLGSDIAWKWMKKGARHTEKGQHTNLKFMKVEIRLLLSKIPNRSVSVFHIYFPDPWPKRRHQKRRLVNPEFLQVLNQKLVSGGLIEMATDDRLYYETMQEALKDCKISWVHVRKQTNERINHPGIKTNYEIKWEREGRTLHYLEVKAP